MHFLHLHERTVRHVAKSRAMVTAKLTTKDRLVIQRMPIAIIKLDAEVARLPDRIAVVDAEGKTIKPSKGMSFYVTVATIDPTHGLIEANEEHLY